MLTTATQSIRADFARNRLLQGLLLWYGLFWAVMAIAPYNRHDWLLENVLVFITVPVLLLTHRRFPFSELSYLLIVLFLTLHAIGAHYTYEKVPLGYWIQDAFQLNRNHFDRSVHFSFGLLIAYPIREGLIRIVGVRGAWAFYLPVSAILSWSGLFEIFEMAAAVAVSPELGNAYLGTQGDVWDAQKDMLAAMIGATICMTLTAGLRKIGQIYFSWPARA